METSTIFHKINKSNIKGLFAILFWIAVWQIVHVFVGIDIIIPSPYDVALKLIEMMSTLGFWQRVGFSLGKITLGFILAAFFGVVVSYLAYKSQLVKTLLHPLISTMKATPVASFIIVALLWIKSTNLSVFISFIMVFPIVYGNVYQGICQLDVKLSQMAQVFNIGYKNRLIYIIVPQIMPYFISASTTGLGIAWKSGVAAEVIANPENSIGEALYLAKLYVDTPALFGWSVVIIALGMSFEKVFILAMNRIKTTLEVG